MYGCSKVFKLDDFRAAGVGSAFPPGRHSDVLEDAIGGIDVFSRMLAGVGQTPHGNAFSHRAANADVT